MVGEFQAKRAGLIPDMGDNEVLIRMSAASINPGDFLFIQSLYSEPKKPTFPQQIAGNHGAGVVVKAGRRTAFKAGDLVAFSYYNAWAEYAVVPAERLIRLPPRYPVEKAAQFVNFITAWDLLSESEVAPGGWLAVTAGNSTVASIVVQMANDGVSMRWR